MPDPLNLPPVEMTTASVFGATAIVAVAGAVIVVAIFGCVVLCVTLMNNQPAVVQTSYVRDVNGNILQSTVSTT